jgi:hypothetical protein
MRPAIAVLGAGLLALAMARPAAAVPVQLDFEGFADGDVISGPGVFSGVEFSTDGTLTVFTMDPAPPELSGIRVVQANPFEHDDPVRADFTVVATAVSVAMGDIGGDVDNLFLRAFDSSGNLLDEDGFALADTTVGGPTLSVSAAAIAYVLFGSTGAFPNPQQLLLRQFHLRAGRDPRGAGSGARLPGAGGRRPRRAGPRPPPAPLTPPRIRQHHCPHSTGRCPSRARRDWSSRVTE